MYPAQKFGIALYNFLMPWAKDKQRIEKCRKQFLAYKKTLHCTHCKLADHRVLEFHHIGDKDLNVSPMVNQGYSWDRIQKEIEKCIPLCCNCHRLEHWTD
jgi:hypothetical protein